MNKYKFLLIILLALQGRAFSQCMTYPVPVSERLNNSQVIVEGKIISKNSFWNASNDFIYTSNVIEVYKVFKGSVTASQIEIITEGGSIGNQLIKAEPALNLEINDVGVFFLKSASHLNPASAIVPSLRFEGYAANQSFLKYDLRDMSAIDPYFTFNDISTSVYQDFTNALGQNFIEIIPYNIFQPLNSGPGSPVPMAIPTITAISSPSTAGTFSVVTITGNNFGIGPFGGTRALEFRDANNGGAGFIPTPANHIVSWTNTSIQAWVPTQAGSGNIRVTNDLNESAISAVTITINFNESNITSGGIYYQPDLINDNGTGGYNFVYNTIFNANAPAVASFERALQTWCCGTFVNFNKTGTSATACQALDGVNLVTFDGACALPAGVLGVSYSYYGACASGVWYLNENDLKFRTNGTSGINWNYGPAPTAGGLFDFETVALHEVGHSHQLGHTILPVTVMNYAVSPNTDRRTLTPISETAGGNDIMSRSVINNSCAPTAMIALTVSNCSINAPIANFTGSPLSGCNSLNVTFTDASTGSPTSWNWSFPGGVPNVFAGQNPPPINYGAPGNYTVTLTVTNGSGTDAETKTNYVVVNNCPPPTADFSGTPLNVCTGQQVFFSDLSTNSPTSWSWTFPGGSPGANSAPNPTVTYFTPGIYDVSLTATNAYGSDPITKTAYITVATCPVAPVANFSATPTTLCAGGNVSFTDLSTNNPNSWQWTFSGGTPVTSILQNPVITYTTAGTYPVTLTASNGAGSNTLTLTGFITVNVCSPPVVNFTGWPTTVCTGSTVSFADQSSNSPTSWSWVYTGGTPAASGIQNPTITYNVPGTYDVSLQATNSFGNNLLTKPVYITVAACPAFGSGLIVNDGSLIHAETGALVTIQGGFINRDNTLTNLGNIDNWGLITLTGDWTNNSSTNAFINSSPGTTEFMGAAQTITGSTTTNFYNLTLTGTGTKTLAINTVAEGTLALNNRELDTQGNWMHVTNASTTAITRTGAMNSTPVQGFVSSTGAGRLRWNTNSTGTYIFPVGSSIGSPRFRPVALTPSNTSANTYAIRFVNNDPTIDGYPITVKDPNIGNINPYWYQKINNISGTTNPDITLFFDNIADNIAPLPSLIMAQWAWNAPPVQWRAISGVTIAGAASPVLSSLTKSAWISFTTENFNLAPQSTPLPVELISFTGTCSNDGINLKWVTASEINNDYFILEGSDDGVAFTEITKIDGAGTTSALTEYFAFDNLQKNNFKRYYRLLQYDFDGVYKESGIIFVNCLNNTNAGTAIEVYPNPTFDYINILILQDIEGDAKISIVNVLGQVILSKVYPVARGMQQIKINLESFAPDMYHILIESGNFQKSVKVVKQD